MITSRAELKEHQRVFRFIIFLLLAGLGSSALHSVAQANEEVQYISELKENLKEPVDVAISDSGDIYVLDKKTAQVVVFDKEGKVRMTFGGKGTAAGKMYKPESIALSLDEKIIVADTGNNRIRCIVQTAQ